MYILSLVEDQNYEGIYTTPIVVSKSNKKLEKFVDLLKKEAVEMKKIWENKEKELEEKYLPLRENQYRRSNEEVEDRKLAFLNIQKLFKNINKIEIHYNIILQGNTSFDIKKIDLI